ncbi:MAG: hypothetical protein RR590_04795, partial [Hungatella sp.]
MIQKENDYEKLAFCIVTYNRSFIVEEFLKQCAVHFHSLGIDIYYYDSSETEETRLIVEDWMVRYTHIHYIRIPSTWHANRKVMSIFEQYGLEQTYDYLWV